MATALVLFLLGALLSWLGWRNLRSVKASMSWPTVSGRVVSSSVRQDVQRGDEDSADTTSHVPHVQYEYQVCGQVYQGNRMAFQDKSFSSHKKAFALVEGFPAGQPVAVFYDPANPGSAVLERQAHGNSVPLVLGPILLIASVAMLFKSL